MAVRLDLLSQDGMRAVSREEDPGRAYKYRRLHMCVCVCVCVCARARACVHVHMPRPKELLAESTGSSQDLSSTILTQQKGLSCVCSCREHRKQNNDALDGAG